MGLHTLAQHLAAKGRGEDSMLVHMTPGEVQGLHALALAHGGNLTVNPETGLVEAGWLSKLLPVIAGFALNTFLPGVGTAIGSALGGLSGAAGTAIAVGGITGLATGSLEKGVMAGLGAYGGAGIGEGLTSLGSAAANQTMAESARLAAQSGLTGTAAQDFIAQQAAQNAPSILDTLKTGAQAAVSSPTDFLRAAGSGSALKGLGTLAAAASPVLAGAMVPTATKMPTLATSTPYLRPMIIDRKPAPYQPLTGSRERQWFQTTYEVPPPTNLLTGQRLPAPTTIAQASGTPGAPTTTQQPDINYPYSPYDLSSTGGMATGGLVAFADGGDAMSDENQRAFDYLTGGLSGESKAAYDYLMGASPTTSTIEAPPRRAALDYVLPRNVATNSGTFAGAGNVETGGGGYGVDIGAASGAASGAGSGIDSGISTLPSRVDTGGEFSPSVTTGVDTSGGDVVGGGNTGGGTVFGGDEVYGGGDNVVVGGGDEVYGGGDNVVVGNETSGGLNDLYKNMGTDQGTTASSTDSTGNAGTDNSYAGTDNSYAGTDNSYAGNAGTDSGNKGGIGYTDSGETCHCSAEGGITNLMPRFNLGGYSDGGRLLRGPGDGVSDSIPATIGHSRQPARLADGEFVIPARIVSELGNGSTEAGARQLYAMMDRIQKARSKTVGKDRVAKNTRAEQYLPA